MKTDPIEFGVCPNCGSTEYMEDYPVKGKRVCIQCGHENVEIELKIVETWQGILDNCPFCGKEGEEDDTLFEKYDIVIFRCKKCGKLDGYKFFDSFGVGLEFDDRSYDPLLVKITEQEGRRSKKIVLPIKASRLREFAKALRKREKPPLEKCKKQLSLLIYERSQEMKAAGISYETIGNARWKTQSFLKNEGPLTNKQLRSIFPAALYLVQNSDLICHGKVLGKKVTERELERIFDVTRKTIRKWKRILQKHAIVEFPGEAEPATRLEKPYEDECAFCQEPKLLYWRIRFVDGSWSDICGSCYTRA